MRIPDYTFFLQSVNIPGLSSNEVFRETPFSTNMLPGDKAQYDTWNMTFLIDEDYRSWLEIHDWIRSYTFPENFDEYRRMQVRYGSKDQTGGQYSEAILTIHDNANVPNLRVKFIGVFPTMISSVQLDQTQDASLTMVSDATFRFSYHQIERIK
jgi:hypothetical protein